MKDTPVYQEALPVLDAIVGAASKGMLGLHSVAFVCVQHLLFTTVSLLGSLVKLGVTPGNIHITGKPYSASPLVINHLIETGYHYYPNVHQQNLGEFADYFKHDIKSMWHAVYDDLKFKNISLIVILDDGGMCLTNVPAFIREKYDLIGIEQTTSGLTNPLMRDLSFPVIEVASSAAKQILESPLIAEAVIKKLDTLLPVSKYNLTCGVVGVGFIGAAITRKLISLNHKVITYDLDGRKTKRFEKACPAETLEEILIEADYIFGCSGKDITEDFSLDTLNKEKTFISCSSQDKEFQTLLKIFNKHHCAYLNVLDNLECTLNSQKVHIIRGGFPVNLDNSGESVSASDIQLTRGLLLGGALQAIVMGSRYPSFQPILRYMLNPTLQSFVVSHWVLNNSTAASSFARSHLWRDIAWVTANSKGFYTRDLFLEQIFHTTDKTKKLNRAAKLSRATKINRAA